MEITRRNFITIAAAALAANQRAEGSVPKVLLRKFPILDKQAQLDRFTFWANRDWDWYKANVPFFESPDRALDELYYYRCELLTRHLRSTPEGYILTEFSSAQPLSWAGRYNAICCSADLQLQEARWLKTLQYAEDYSRYFMTNAGAQPRNYGWPACWTACEVDKVHGTGRLATGLLDRYVANFAEWEKGLVAYPHDNGYDPGRCLFWNTGRDMGEEFNLASCQLSEQLRGIVGYKIRGGAGYRPEVNAVFFAEATAIAELARAAGRADITTTFAQKAAVLQHATQQQLWDKDRQFFLHRWRRDEYADGDLPGKPSISAGSLIWETNAQRLGVGYQPHEQGAGRGRELTGFIPWRYHLPDDDTNFVEAWKYLISPDHFNLPYGPSTAERHDPWFYVVYKNCCHNGQAWPFHTAHILSAAANLLNDYQRHGAFTPVHYRELFAKYVLLQHDKGRPWVAECHSPFNADWTRNEWPGIHYFHSSFIDLVITGLVGLRPRGDDTLELNPLAAPAWPYFALDDVLYRGRKLSIVWDRAGNRYHFGPGLHVIVDGKLLASRPTLGRILIDMPPAAAPPVQRREVDFAANPLRAPHPKASASYTTMYYDAQAPLDGLCWYDMDYLARWTTQAVWTSSDWYAVDFGVERLISTVRMGIYADAKEVQAPTTAALESWQDNAWRPIVPTRTSPSRPTANRAYIVEFAPIRTAKLRVLFTHAVGQGVGLASFQAIGFIDEVSHA